ncbi:MAG: GLUG motif-containing protein [Ruminococcus callidus]|nr:GLUG motif-containing protein [Ruminococcus callidus]
MVCKPSKQRQYILQENGVEEVWGQRIGTDKTPVLKGEKVYLSSKYSGCAEKYKGDLLSTSYTNDASAEIVYSEHQYDENGICTVCGDVKLVEPEKDINGVYLIADMHNLFWFANEVNNGNVNINAMLASDIVINRDVLDESGNLNSSLTNPIAWTPIGTSNYIYKGEFDGDGHTISGLYFNDEDVAYVGLFSFNAGKIRNVGIVDSYLKGEDYVGGLCGHNYNVGTIENSYNTGSVSGSEDVGGLCGENYGGTIKNSYNIGSVNCSNYVGGLCGYNAGNGIIENIYYLEGCVTGLIVGASDVVKSSDAFANGEVAYLLQKGSEIWGQNIGVDKAPVLNGEKVFAGYEHGKDNVSYSNTKFVHETPNVDASHDELATGDVVRYDKDGHYVECECGAEVKKAHTFGAWKTKDNGKVHYHQCTECGYKESHEAEVEYSFTSHAHKASFCEFHDCDIAGTGYEEHSFTKTYVADSKRHFKECETCGYISSAAHNFENGVCVDCGYEKSLKDAIGVANIDYSVTNGKNRLIFNVDRDIPDSYKVIENGVICCNDGSIKSIKDAENQLVYEKVNGTSIKKGVSSLKTNNGRYVSKIADNGNGVYVKPFVKAQKADGTVVIAYGETVFEKYAEIAEETIRANVEFSIINTDIKDGKLVFSVYRDVADGFKVVEHGLICNNTGEIENKSEAESKIILENAGKNNIKRAKSSTTSNYGVYKVKVAYHDAEIYARGYIIVEDSFGNRATIYTNVNSGNVIY